MRSFESPLSTVFFKSPRANDTRLGEIAKPINELQINAKPAGHVLLGYPDDEGIRMNHGRVGAKDAPDTVRAALYKLTPSGQKFPALYDLGNLTRDGDIQSRHLRALKATTQLYQAGHRIISIGGGHDYAYPDIAGFLSLKHKKRPLVINIDAHLDMRPDNEGPNSGTAFYRLLEKHEGFDLVELGIQKFTNSVHFLNYARVKKAKVFYFEETHKKLATVLKSLKAKGRPVFISVDIDAFSSAYAPGASASYPIGLDPYEFISILPWMAKEYQLMGMGIYEVSPPLDTANMTSKLAAIIAHSYLTASGDFAQKKKK